MNILKLPKNSLDSGRRLAAGRPPVFAPPTSRESSPSTGALRAPLGAWRHRSVDAVRLERIHAPGHGNANLHAAAVCAVGLHGRRSAADRNPALRAECLAAGVRAASVFQRHGPIRH